MKWKTELKDEQAVVYEDLSDALELLSQQDTPFMSSMQTRINTLMTDFGIEFIMPFNISKKDVEKHLDHFNNMAQTMFERGERGPYELSVYEMPKAYLRELYDRAETHLSFDNWVDQKIMEAMMGV